MDYFIVFFIIIIQFIISKTLSKLVYNGLSTRWACLILEPSSFCNYSKEIVSNELKLFEINISYIIYESRDTCIYVVKMNTFRSK